MRKLILFLLISTVMVYAQYSEPTPDQLYLEEYGSEYITDPVPVSCLDATSWNQLPNAPNAFGRTVIGAIGEYVYIFASQNATSMAAAYHIPTNTWVASTPCQFPAFNSAYCVANGELYKFSGSGATSNFEKFTPTAGGLGTWTTLPSTSTTLMTAQSSIVYGGDNYIYAYSSGVSSPFPSYFARFHIVNQTWENMATPQYPRRYAGMAMVNGAIYLIGGLLSDGTSGDICQKYDIATNTWSLIAPAPEVLNFTKWTVTEDGRYVYIIGSGGGYSSGALSSNVYYYDPLTNVWTLESICPAPRGLATGIVLKDYGKVFWGGGNDGTSGTAYQNNVWEGVGGPYIPVELVSFTATVVNGGIRLEWSTSSETNNKAFHIERRFEGENWSRIATINGAGTSASVNNYYFSDMTVVSGKYNYRLAQEDFSGKINYSDIIDADFGAPLNFELAQNYPNPFNPSTTIRFAIPAESAVRLELFDIMGKLVSTPVNKNLAAGVYARNIDINRLDLSSGVYYYKLTAGSFSKTMKMTILK